MEGLPYAKEAICSGVTFKLEVTQFTKIDIVNYMYVIIQTAKKFFYPYQIFD